MITSLVIGIGTLIINLIAGLLNILGIILPVKLTEAIALGISYSAYFVGILPIVEIMGAVTFLLLWITAIYTRQFILFALGFIPGFGIGTKHVKHEK